MQKRGDLVMAVVEDQQDDESFDSDQKMTERQLLGEDRFINYNKPRDIPIGNAHNIQLSQGRVTTALGSTTHH